MLMNIADLLCYSTMLEVQLLREARRRAGLTQRELADRLGTTQSSIARMESGVVSPTFATLRSAIEACDRKGSEAWGNVPPSWVHPDKSPPANGPRPRHGKREQEVRRQNRRSRARYQRGHEIQRPRRQEKRGRSRVPPQEEQGHPGKRLRPAEECHRDRSRAGWQKRIL